MKSVLLRLEGPMQSWGTQGRFSIRDTDREPSKSGVLGLVGAALGMPRDDEEQLAKLAALRFAVRVDRAGNLLRDYHTAGGGTFRGQAHGVWGTDNPVPTHRYYLTDASFTAALGGDDHALVERIAQALESPVWPLFLGRRACPPSVPVYLATFDGTPEDAVRTAAPADRAEPRMRLLLEATADRDGTPRTDEPASFVSTARRFATRYVVTEWVDRGGSTSVSEEPSP